MNKKLFLLFSIVVILIGLLIVENREYYYCGVTFFLFGFYYFVDTPSSEMSIFPIFHLTIGFTTMIGTIFKIYNKEIDSFTLEFFNNPIISDNNGYFYPYVGLSLFLAILALSSMFYFGLSRVFREKKYSLMIIMILFTISLLMIAILPRILKYL